MSGTNHGNVLIKRDLRLKSLDETVTVMSGVTFLFVDVPFGSCVKFLFGYFFLFCCILPLFLCLLHETSTCD